MLTLGFEIDKSKVKSVYVSLGIDEEPSGVNVIYYDEQRAVGFLRMKLEDETVVLDKIVFDDAVETGDKDFFIRGTFFKLINRAPVLVKIKGNHDELKTFGFTYGEDGYMSVLSSSISLCGGCASKKD